MKAMLILISMIVLSGCGKETEIKEVAVYKVPCINGYVIINGQYVYDYYGQTITCN